MRLPTVRVVNPSQPDSYVIINESDFDSSQHQLYDSSVLPQPHHPGRLIKQPSDGVSYPSEAAARIGAGLEPEIPPSEAQPVGASDTAGADDLRVAKGPGGKWFVWRGKQIVSGRLDSEDAALDALRNMREPVA